MLVSGSLGERRFHRAATGLEDEDDDSLRRGGLYTLGMMNGDLIGDIMMTYCIYIYIDIHIYIYI